MPCLASAFLVKCASITPAEEIRFLEDFVDVEKWHVLFWAGLAIPSSVYLRQHDIIHMIK